VASSVRHITVLCAAVAVASFAQSCSNSTEPEIGSDLVDLVRRLRGLVGSFLLPGPQELLGLDAQTIGYTRDVVEVSDHLDGIVDGAFVEPVPAQRLQIAGLHLAGA